MQRIEGTNEHAVLMTLIPENGAAIKRRYGAKSDSIRFQEKSQLCETFSL